MGLPQTLPELAIPVCFLEGKFELTCVYSLAKDYFEVLKAPVKGFHTFENSAHSPMFEEPEKMRRIVREDVRKGTNVLAKAKSEAPRLRRMNT